MTGTAHPPKQATAETGAQAIFDLGAQAGGELSAFDRDLIFGPWREIATAVGQSGPANINRANRAIRAIRGSRR